jgi:hypothetical protein
MKKLKKSVCILTCLASHTFMYSFTQPNNHAPALQPHETNVIPKKPEPSANQRTQPLSKTQVAAIKARNQLQKFTNMQNYHIIDTIAGTKGIDNIEELKPHTTSINNNNQNKSEQKTTYQTLKKNLYKLGSSISNTASSLFSPSSWYTSKSKGLQSNDAMLEHHQTGLNNIQKDIQTVQTTLDNHAIRLNESEQTNLNNQLEQLEWLKENTQDNINQTTQNSKKSAPTQQPMLLKSTNTAPKPQKTIQEELDQSHQDVENALTTTGSTRKNVLTKQQERLTSMLQQQMTANERTQYSRQLQEINQALKLIAK